ncbi:MAG: glycosyltransferase [Burkholderiaceae bacterium]|jgi:rhamnosyltransferase|nr:glycosyltransferase [Burkholderiaceae bacterium]
MENRNKSVCVLLSSYNGEKYLTVQLDSLLAQRGVNLKILVRDDGSSDGTCAILEKYQQAGKLNFFQGENVGYAKSFYLLVKNAPDCDYYAYCDQDDFWEEDKLSTAVAMLEKLDKEKPALYYSALKVVDKDLNFLYNSHKNFKIGAHPFQGSFLLANTYGCTSVFNAAARDKLLKYKYETFYAHDANINMVAAALGTVVFDPTPHVQYRQHENNIFGYPDMSLKKIKKTLHQIFHVDGQNMRLKEMRKIKAQFYDELSDENKEFCDLICNYKNSPQDRDRLLNYKLFKTNDLIFNFLLRWFINKGRL